MEETKMLVHGFINYIKANKLEKNLYDNLIVEEKFTLIDKNFARIGEDYDALPIGDDGIPMVKFYDYRYMVKRTFLFKNKILESASDIREENYMLKDDFIIKDDEVRHIYLSRLEDILLTNINLLYALCDEYEIDVYNLIKYFDRNEFLKLKNELEEQITNLELQQLKLKKKLDKINEEYEKLPKPTLQERNFVKKFKTTNFILGSFDVYYDESKKLILNNNLSIEDADEELKKYPTSYRMAILNKNHEFVGFISVYDYDAKNFSSSIRLQTINGLSQAEKKEILDVYKKWVDESLNLGNIKEESIIDADTISTTQNRTIKSNIIIPPKNLKEGIDDKVFEEMSQQYSIPKLSFPFTIVNGNQTLGVIGLTNLIWANRRASLNIYLNRDIDSSIALEISSKIIDDYLNYLHDLNIFNVSYSIDGDDEKMIDVINNTEMQFYAEIPYSVKNDKGVGSKFMFQHYPNMDSKKLYIPNNEIVDDSIFTTEKKELSSVIDIDDKYKLVTPKSIDERDKQNIILGFAKSMQQRENFTIPLGEDKYVPQIGNGNYGLSKTLMNYSYILLDNYNNYCGFINIIRSDENNKNAEIEVGIKPELQHGGLGTKITNAFYNELFSLGYSSVTSAIFSFNEPSLRMHEKIANLNGVRIGSYYVNGKLWDMNYYTKTNPIIDLKK